MAAGHTAAQFIAAEMRNSLRRPWRHPMTLDMATPDAVGHGDTRCRWPWRHPMTLDMATPDDARHGDTRCRWTWRPPIVAGIT